MNKTALKKRSKTLSWLLRFGANEAGLPMDTAGWAELDLVMGITRMSRATIDTLVAQNDKQRFQLEGTRIRATQGHGADMPVTEDALELSWATWEDDGLVFHGTGVDNAFGIARGGVEPQSRTHVHMSATQNSKVGKRSGVQLLLEVSPVRMRAQGLRLFRSPNGVILARRVPANCVVGIRPLCRKARGMLADLNRAFSLG